MVTRIQILDETDCIQHSTNTLGKGINPIILPPAMGKQQDRLGSSALVRQLVQEKENSEFKPVKLRLKIDLVSYPARAEGLGKQEFYLTQWQGPIRCYYSCQSGLGSNGNELVLHIPKSSGITGASLSDCLMLSRTFVGENLLLYRKAVSVFYSSGQLGFIKYYNII